MKNINLKNSIYTIVGISFLILSVQISLHLPENIDFPFIVKSIPKTVSIDLIIIGLFGKYFWKWKIFKGWLVPFPNLNGTWKGTIQTTWEDPITKMRPSPIPAILSIKQSFFNVSCVMRTGEMTSRSFMANFILDEEHQVCKLVYTYDSNPKATVKERSPQHFGTMIFDVIEKPQRKLDGEYFTGRKTTGHIAVFYWKKQLADEYPVSIGEHPVSEVRSK
jgi:hypothetical protein